VTSAIALALAIAQAVSPQPSLAPTPAPTAAPTSTATPSAVPNATPTAPATRQSNVLSIPASWRAQSVKPTAEVIRRIGEWSDGAGNGEAIALDVSPSFGMDLKKLEESAATGIRHQVSVTMLSSAPLQLCHGRAGWKQTYRDTSGEGMTFVYALTKSRAYVVSYTYPAYPGPSPQGETAAESLCPPPDPVVSLPPPPLEPPAKWIAEDPNAYTTPRAGWIVWMWHAPLKERVPQRLMVAEFPLPPSGGISYGFTEWITRYANGKATVLKRVPAELCHRSVDGVYVAMRVIDPDGKAMLLESVMTVAGHRAYAAVYSRVNGEAARREAYDALASLCPANSK
jgi:hypothetical protein